MLRILGYFKSDVKFIADDALVSLNKMIKYWPTLLYNHTKIVPQFTV